jgi:5-methyltetrahydrofolate--homocysteine methyltransferase
VKNKRLRMVGIVGIYPANSVGDDIEVYTDESRAEVSQRRQGGRGAGEGERQRGRGRGSQLCG